MFSCSKYSRMAFADPFNCFAAASCMRGMRSCSATRFPRARCSSESSEAMLAESCHVSALGGTVRPSSSITAISRQGFCDAEFPNMCCSSFWHVLWGDSCKPAGAERSSASNSGHCRTRSAPFTAITTSSLLHFNATRSGVDLGSPPTGRLGIDGFVAGLLSNSSATSNWPQRQAHHRGVRPHTSSAFGFALYSRSFRTAATLPDEAAICNACIPERSRAPTLAPSGSESRLAPRRTCCSIILLEAMQNFKLCFVRVRCNNLSAAGIVESSRADKPSGNLW
mmetsp:Transcript_66631/g.118434  ORF Transcript_66631/g.118434 Transcript_66631/m.118434 type:complete len:281 (-) Transcript_66631:532-1374(-)